MSADTPEQHTGPRIIASANIGGSDTRSFALVALVENPSAAQAWFEQLCRRFKQAGDDAAMAVAEAKARLTTREQAVTERENAAERLLIKLQEKTDAINEALKYEAPK